MKKSALLIVLLITNFIFAKSNEVSANLNNNEIKILRLNYSSPNGASRELLLGFTSDNSATDGVDYGYDAAVYSPFNNDLNWLIENNRYTIQGVGSFENTKQYPFGLYISANLLLCS